MPGTFVGGGGYKAIYRMTTAHDDIANKTTGTALGVAPTTADAAYILTDDPTNEIIIEQSQFSFDEDGVGSFSFTTNDQTNAFLDFLAIAAPLVRSTATATPNEKTSEAGYVIGGDQAGTGRIPYLIISAGASDGTNILTDMAIGYFSRTSLSTTTQANDQVMVTLAFTSVYCKNTGGFVIDQGAFDATIWGTIGTAGDRTIPENGYGKRYGLTAA